MHVILVGIEWRYALDGSEEKYPKRIDKGVSQNRHGKNRFRDLRHHLRNGVGWRVDYFGGQGISNEAED